MATPVLSPLDIMRGWQRRIDAVSSHSSAHGPSCGHAFCEAVTMQHICLLRLHAGVACSKPRSCEIQ